MNESHYKFECVCGVQIQSHAAEGTCAACGRDWRIEREASGVVKTPPQAKVKAAAS